MKISKLIGKEIYDSRGNFTIRVRVVLDSGVSDFFDVPSGASKGSHEAIELRNTSGSVLPAIQKLDVIESALKDIDLSSPLDLDKFLIDMDGTENKSNLGGNTTLGVSVAFLKAYSKNIGVSYYMTINKLLNSLLKSEGIVVDINIPVPMFNILNGGQHADNHLLLQEFMVIPTQYFNNASELKKKPVSDYLNIGATILHLLSKRLKDENFFYGVGDEGGVTTDNISDSITALANISDAVKSSGYKLYDDVCFGIDCASNYYYNEQTKEFTFDNAKYTSESLLPVYLKLLDDFPISYIEDPYPEESFDDFASLVEDSSNSTLIAGDDLITTNPVRLKKAIDNASINSVIIKPNQIGTVMESLETVKLSILNDITYIPSHRSGETLDSFITDFAVGTGAKLLKAGSMQRGERIAKYIRLLEIEDELNGNK